MTHLERLEKLRDKLTDPQDVAAVVAVLEVIDTVRELSFDFETDNISEGDFVEGVMSAIYDLEEPTP